MDRLTSLGRDKAKKPVAFYISTPLYFATTVFSLTAHILLILSGDGYSSSQHDLLMFPILALFFSLMTGPIRCFFWTLSFCVQIKILQSEDTEWGRIKLGDGEGTTREREYVSVGKILLSWNAWVAATLAAAWGVLIWRLVENARGRVLYIQAEYGAAFLGVACVLHILLAIPGYGDRKFAVLCHPFKEEYQMLREDGEEV